MSRAVQAAAAEGRAMIEFDMNAIGTFATTFAGAPVKKAQPA